MTRARPGALASPSVQRLIRVARALGDLTGEVVFIGGAIAPLLQVRPPFAETRPTKDVDGVIASSRYADLARLAEALHQRGFRQHPADTAHLHRWRTPAGDALDLVPAGSHPGGSGQAWDRFALDYPVALELEDGLTIRHAGAPAFLALKWAAFADRGRADPFASHDLEDILALLASRDTLVAEVDGAPHAVQDFVTTSAARLLGDDRISDLLAGHLNNAQDPAETIRQVRARLGALATLAST